MLWPHPYQLIATPHMRTEETTLNDKAKIKLVQQQPNLLCVEAFAIMKVSRLLPQA